MKQKKSYFLIALLSLNDLAIGVLGNPGVVVLIVKTLQKTKFNECATFYINSIGSKLFDRYFVDNIVFVKFRTIFVHSTSILSSERGYKVANMCDSVGSMDARHTTYTFAIIRGNNHAIFENFGHNYCHSSILVHVHVYISCQSKNGKSWSVSIKLDSKEHKRV